MNILKSLLIAVIVACVMQIGICAIALENDSKTYIINGDTNSVNVGSITIPAEEDDGIVYYSYIGPI